MEWWVIAIGVGAGYLADRGFAKAGWEPGTLVAWGIGITTIFVVMGIGYAVQKDDCEAWRERVYETADQIYNPETMTEDEATGSRSIPWFVSDQPSARSGWPELL